MLPAEEEPFPEAHRPLTVVKIVRGTQIYEKSFFLLLRFAERVQSFAMGAMGSLSYCGFSACRGAPPATPNSDYRNGVLYGRVVDVVTGKPIPDATVALQDKNGKVVAWSKTNEKGEYAIAADPMNALALRASRRRGLLEQVCRAVGNASWLRSGRWGCGRQSRQNGR